MAALVDAGTGITGDADDLTDTSPGYGTCDSLTTITDPNSLISKTDWTPFPFLYEGLLEADPSKGEQWGMIF